MGGRRRLEGGSSEIETKLLTRIQRTKVRNSHYIGQRSQRQFIMDHIACRVLLYCVQQPQRPDKSPTTPPWHSPSSIIATVSTWARTEKVKIRITNYPSIHWPLTRPEIS